MNVSLYEISADFLKALDGLEVDEETGEIMNFDAVEALDAQFEDKAETCPPSATTSRSSWIMTPMNCSSGSDCPATPSGTPWRKR